MRIFNKKFQRDYQKIASFEAGILLEGSEVKSIRKGRLRLAGGYVKIIGGQVYLLNVEIPAYKYSRLENYQPFRTRKLLLHRKEIIRLIVKLKSSQKLTIVPVSCYNKGRHIKLEIALAKARGIRGRKSLEKRKKKIRTVEREMKEHLKN